jgi:pumilio RNA-binding family
MYAAATAAMYMAGNPYYPTLNSTAVYAPHYGISGYPVNPTVFTPIMAGYPPPVAFDAATAAAVAASMGGRQEFRGLQLKELLICSTFINLQGKLAQGSHPSCMIQSICSSICNVLQMRPVH